MGIQTAAPAKAAGEIRRLGSPSDSQSEKMKRNEKLVYEALLSSDSPLKAYDLLDALHDEGLRAPMTIYRALDALVAMGRVKKIESLNAFAPIRNHATALPSGFIICRKCKRVKEIELDQEQIAALFLPVPVAFEDVRIEAFSECKGEGCALD